MMHTYRSPFKLRKRSATESNRGIVRRGIIEKAQRSLQFIAMC